MFEAELMEKIKRIFKLNKVTMDLPGESQEQNCGFISIGPARCSIREKKELARVEGTLTLYGNTDRMKYGYFSKRMDEASKEDLASFFFYDVEENAIMMRNIVQRSISFIFFFSGQYDPDIGTLNSVTIEETE